MGISLNRGLSENVSTLFGIILFVNIEATPKGHDICLKSFSPLDSDHTAYCLPAEKPEYCSKKSWERLQTDFDGKCPEPSKVPGYKDCIVETNDAEHPHCLPFVYKPEYCSEKSWNEIHQKVFQFRYE